MGFIFIITTNRGLLGICNMLNPDSAIDNALGIAQQQIYLPDKLLLAYLIEK